MCVCLHLQRVQRKARGDQRDHHARRSSEEEGVLSRGGNHGHPPRPIGRSHLRIQRQTEVRDGAGVHDDHGEGEDESGEAHPHRRLRKRTEWRCDPTEERRECLQGEKAVHPPDRIRTLLSVP